MERVRERHDRAGHPYRRVFKVVGRRGVTDDGIATATDRGAWVEQIESDSDGIKERWIVHWSDLERVAD
ncbi:hypothetical protein [Streptomyces albipurpureus]|uniref:Uncharacterized protein n=1 Tax=Streptomyces albipurpureus TaxID=2897419 RepID=A0ABT0UVR6_9ACTN|nr:hypothetical protein [Streptomyces sp. CWNU-1]MCM2392668.1 hypothetical protein [Streptomyces sp. CWNU-1]